jgi:ATP-dependent helicase/nuclease subunit A
MTATLSPRRKTVTQPRRFSHVVIRASAGSGKTFQLSNRYLALLSQGVPPEKILAVTFTRKAAGEIFDRIVLRLADAAADESECQKLAGFIQAENLTTERCRELLVGVTRALHRLRVGTLDSFFSKVAGSCSLELGLPLGWRMVEELEDARLRDRAIADCLASQSEKPLVTLVNLLTKGDAARSISQLVRDTVQNLYMTARETEPAVWKLLPRCKPLPQEELLAAQQGLLGLSVNHKGIMKEIAKDRECLDIGTNRKLSEFVGRGYAVKLLEGATAYFGKPIPDEVREIYGKLIHQVKSRLVNKLADQTEATYDLLAHFREYYEQLKLSHGALRFDDVTFALSHGAFLDVADDERVTFRLDACVDHLLLDEFQDTSLAQWSVLRPIAKRVTSSHTGTSFFCVGDTKQAIYGWRGGLAELFDAVQQELPELEEVPLDKSFRSSQAVIDVVNQVFTNLHQHEDLEKYGPAVLAWGKRFRQHTTDKTDLPGYVAMESCERFEGEEDDGPEARELADQAFLDFAAERIAKAYHDSPGATIGVLTRTNDAVTQLIYRLRKLQIPASEEGGNPLTDSCAVELILSLLRLADHPGDLAAAYHVACSPLASECGLTATEFDKTALLSEKLRGELIDSGYGRAVYRWSQLLAPSCDARDRSRLQQLVELAYAYQPESTLRPGDFLQFVERQRVSDPTTSAVRVMTVHQAKGLEFDIVVLPELDSGRTLLGQPPAAVWSREGLGGEINCVCRYTNENEQRLLPASFQEMFDNSSDRQINEALCVLYVAMTRAVHALHLLVRPLRERRNGDSKLPKTFAGLLRAALCRDANGSTGLIYQHGQANWYDMSRARGEFEVSGTDAEMDDLSAGPAKIVLAPPLAQRRRGLDRQSPSRMKASEEKVRQALEIVDPKRATAMIRGSVIHFWFEQVRWLEDGVPADELLLAALAQVRGAEVVSESARRTWLADFRQMLLQPETAAILSRATYLRSCPAAWHSEETTFDVRNEWPFARIADARIISGRMDRVVFHVRNGRRVAADVLDYKTDVISDALGERLEDRVEHYRGQMEEYCRTLIDQTGLPADRVSSALLFVGKGIVARI